MIPTSRQHGSNEKGKCSICMIVFLVVVVVVVVVLLQLLASILWDAPLPYQPPKQPCHYQQKAEG
jgi:hypothetical protein